MLKPGDDLLLQLVGSVGKPGIGSCGNYHGSMYVGYAVIKRALLLKTGVCLKTDTASPS